ncbi:hypothetical protein HK096_004780 [Nowakowskiella sp. JEL0078]|nr:hypothetical protein HK096_004780 [Nowakowskiella sp. JEL0078]
MEIVPSFVAQPTTPEAHSIQILIKSLGLQQHIEGGYFVETDRAKENIRSPFPSEPSSTTNLVTQRPEFIPELRSLSTSIFYLLTPNSPQGGFHRNKSRTIHTLHRGRGVYVLIHADEPGDIKRIESFVVGSDVAAGERLQWVVEGNKYKASYLLPDIDGGKESSGLLISETVVPGFEYCDHDFLSQDALLSLKKEQEETEQILQQIKTGNKSKQATHIAYLTFSEATVAEDKVEWKNAMDDEMKKIKEYNVWELVDLPKERKTIGCKWHLI